MKRLTSKYPDGTIQGTGTLDEILLRLAAYEDTGVEPEDVLTALEMAHLFAELRKLEEVKKAESEGRLLILPYKVGDHVYTAQRGIVSELVVTCIEVYLSQLWIQWEIISGIYGRFRMDGFPADDIGKTVFLTREEAEAALRMEANDGN